MIRQIDISATPEQAADDEQLKKIIIEALGGQSDGLKGYRILRRSIDARRQTILIRIKADVYVDENIPAKKFPSFYFHNTSNSSSVIIVGAGPAGLFAALRLLEAGIKPIIIERGKTVRARRRDIADLNKNHIINPDSNYCFGEGGAGTYSDGKLYTRSTKRGEVQKILELFVQHGASEDILIDTHPHIGTNKLPHIIEKIRKTIMDHGGEYHFDNRLKDILIRDQAVKGVITESVTNGKETEFLSDSLILATGHSARDVFKLLDKKNILLEAKAFAMGVRVEHPQELIDSIQYHCSNDAELTKCRKFLPPASYSLVHQVKNRGVYSFCMCPGGIIAPCATSPNEVVVNGWSPSKRNNPFANSGMVVTIEEEDLQRFAKYGKFAGLQYQESLEHMAHEAGGKTQTAPAQRLVDFVEGKLSSTLPETSYQPGIKSVLLDALLPGSIARPLQEAFRVFGKKMRGYLTNEAVIHAIESRTSSPIRIPRNKLNFEHPQIRGLYPVGEGAGYAGGIVSAAIDGQKAAEHFAQKLASKSH